MLDHMEAKGDDEIVSWQPHGRAFVVRKPKEFVAQIMPQFFNQTKYASFQRQLNLYGFSRLTHGPDKGAYYHSCFIRGERHLCRRMIRQKIKGTKVRKSLSPEEEPNFYNMTGAIPTIPSEEEIAMQLNQGRKHRKKSASAEVTPVTAKQVKRASSSRRRSSTASVTYPVVAQAPQPSRNNSYVLVARTGLPLPGATRTVSPHASTATLSDSHQRIRHMPMVPMAPMASAQAAAARGGDLLFFEGQPFRYLEHIEVATTKGPSQTTATCSSNPPRRSTSLQDMITTIVNRDPQQQPQVCSI
ncbi:MAG: hypothetical protein SGILL_005012 [Bacillariaceae sp.]